MQRLPTTDTKLQPNSDHPGHQITLTLFTHKSLSCKNNLSTYPFQQFTYLSTIKSCLASTTTSTKAKDPARQPNAIAKPSLEKFPPVLRPSPTKPIARKLHRHPQPPWKAISLEQHHRQYQSRPPT